MKILETKLNKNCIKILLAMLRDMEKNVILMKHGFYGNEYSFSEIGENLNISKQSAYQYYWTGIRRIRKIFKEAA